MSDLTPTKKIQQKISKIKEQEAKLKNQERKIRTKKLIELGGLVKKSGLENLTSNFLYGALLSIKDQSLNIEKMKQWETLGGSTFNAEKREETLKIVTVSLKEKPTSDIKESFKKIGLKWNALRSEFEGRIDLEMSQSKIELCGGTITLL